MYLDRHIKNVLVEYFVLDFIVSIQLEEILHTCKIWNLILLNTGNQFEGDIVGDQLSLFSCFFYQIHFAFIIT